MRCGEIARSQGRFFQVVLEDALREYVESREQPKPNPEFMAHVQG